MGEKDYEWLPHLETSLPLEAQGTKVSSYAIALEGWRRGLRLKYINRERNPFKIRYSLSDGEKEVVFAGSRGDTVTREAIQICMNKYLTKEYLKKSNVPTPQGEIFNRHSTDEQILNYAEQIGYPLVIKPVSGSGGDGVIANIKTEDELVDALRYVKYDLKFTDIIVEKYFHGVDHRVYVIGDKVVAAFDRIPANVIGDGINTIDDLIKLKIRERQKNPALYNRPIKIDEEVHNLLRTKGYTLNTVPEKGERVFLKTKNNVSSGGDSRDVTDELSTEIKKIAVNATKAIPGLVQAGVDIMVDKKNNTGVVLEINSRPSIRNHLFPMVGKARDIPKEIIDYYFPETRKKYNYLNKPLFNFDLKSIHDIFRKGFANEYQVQRMPVGDLIAIHFELFGQFNSKRLSKWIRKWATNLRLNGHVKFNANNKIIIVLAGEKSSISEFKNTIKSNLPTNTKVDHIKESIWNEPITIGFRIKKSK